MLKLIAAGLVLASTVAGDDPLSIGNLAADEERGGSHYGGRRNWADSTLEENAKLDDDAWLAKKLHKAERDLAREADADWRKKERPAYRAKMEDEGTWAAMGKTNQALKMGDDAWGKNKMFSDNWTALDGYTADELDMTRKARNAAFRARARALNSDAAAAAASDNCKDLLRNKLNKCLAIEAAAKADDCTAIEAEYASNKNILACLAMVAAYSG